MTCETLIDCVIISKRSEAAKILFWQVLILNFSMSRHVIGRHFKIPNYCEIVIWFTK